MCQVGECRNTSSQENRKFMFSRPDLNLIKIITRQCVTLQGKMIFVFRKQRQLSPSGHFSVFLLLMQTVHACFCFCKQCVKVSESHCV